METDTSRQYSPPVPVSSTTAVHYRQFRQSSTRSHGPSPLPESHDLLTIKADLQALLPHLENCLRRLQSDLRHSEKNAAGWDHGKPTLGASQSIIYARE